jgi:CysZ protein
MIRAFELAIRQLGDPRLRVVIWQSLALSLVLQIAIGVVAWWALQSFATFKWDWLNETIRWLGGGAVAVLALMLFPASFGIVISIFLEKIADIVEAEHYPQLGKARGIPVALFYGANGWLTGREYYEQVALRRRDPADVKAWRKANGGVLWLTGIAIVFLGTIPILNLIVPVLGVAAMVHVAQTLKPPLNLPAGPR